MTKEIIKTGITSLDDDLTVFYEFIEKADMSDINAIVENKQFSIEKAREYIPAGVLKVVFGLGHTAAVTALKSRTNKEAGEFLAETHKLVNKHFSEFLKDEDFVRVSRQLISESINDEDSKEDIEPAHHNLEKYLKVPYTIAAVPSYIGVSPELIPFIRYRFLDVIDELIADIGGDWEDSFAIINGVLQSFQEHLEKSNDLVANNMLKLNEMDNIKEYYEEMMESVKKIEESLTKFDLLKK